MDNKHYVCISLKMYNILNQFLYTNYINKQSVKKNIKTNVANSKKNTSHTQKRNVLFYRRIKNITYVQCSNWMFMRFVRIIYKTVDITLYKCLRNGGGWI